MVKMHDVTRLPVECNTLSSTQMWTYISFLVFKCTISTKPI